MATDLLRKSNGFLTDDKGPYIKNGLVAIPLILGLVGITFVLVGALNMQSALVRGKKQEESCGSQVFEGDTVRGLAYDTYVNKGVGDILKNGKYLMITTIYVIFGFVVLLCAGWVEKSLPYGNLKWLAILPALIVAFAYIISFGFIFKIQGDDRMTKYLEPSESKKENSVIAAKVIMYLFTFAALILSIYVFTPEETATTDEYPALRYMTIWALGIFTFTLVFYEIYSRPIEMLEAQLHDDKGKDYKAIAKAINDEVKSTVVDGRGAPTDFMRALLQRNIKKVDGDNARGPPVVEDPKYWDRYYLYIEHGFDPKAVGGLSPSIMANMTRLEELDRKGAFEALVPSARPPVTQTLGTLTTAAWTLIVLVLLVIFYLIMHYSYTEQPTLTTYASIIGMFGLLAVTTVIAWMAGVGVA